MRRRTRRETARAAEPSLGTAWRDSLPGLPAYSAPCDFRHACACSPSVVSTLGYFLMNREWRMSKRYPEQRYDAYPP